MYRVGKRWLLLLVTPGLLIIAGCINPLGMGIFTPVPVPPWVAERIEEQFEHKNDHRTPILAPVIDGFPAPLCEDPPTEAEVLRTIRHPIRGVPYIYEEQRQNIKILNTREVDRIDPPRFFPIIGWARLHHCHWKCDVRFTEIVQSDFLPAKILKERLERVYIDKDHLHLFVGYDQQTQKDVSEDFINP